MLSHQLAGSLSLMVPPIKVMSYSRKSLRAVFRFVGILDSIFSGVLDPNQSQIFLLCQRYHLNLETGVRRVEKRISP